MKAQDSKDIKTSNADIIKVIANNEVWWKKSTVPGPSKLIGGNLQAGFYGEVPTRDFITGDELARRIGLTAGVSQFSNEPWLKFSYLGNTEFVAKKTFRCAISWDDINSIDAVKGNRTIEIKGQIYKIRLMKCVKESEQNSITTGIGTFNRGSEWNKLMLPIHRNAPSSWKYPDNVESPTANWNVNYSDADLLTIASAGNGSCTWCQEYAYTDTGNALKGRNGISYSESYYSHVKNNACGWRPVLELVGELKISH